MVGTPGTGAGAGSTFLVLTRRKYTIWPMPRPELQAMVYACKGRGGGLMYLERLYAEPPIGPGAVCEHDGPASVSAALGGYYAR